MRTRWFALTTMALMGCTAVIGVRDIYFDENDRFDSGADDGGNDGNVVGSDANAEASSCLGANNLTSPEHCGRCDHNCLGGTCVQGICQPVQLATVATAPLEYIVTSSTHVFVTSSQGELSGAGGIWRIPKTGGTPEPFVSDAVAHYAEGMVIVGTTLYFYVWESVANGGGVWACPTNVATCVPRKVADALNPRGIAADQGKIYYSDETGNGLMEVAPDASPPTVFRPGFGAISNLMVSGTAAFYSYAFVGPPNTLTLWEILPDAATVDRGAYNTRNVNAGQAQATAQAVYYTGFEYFPDAGGIVRRYPRVGGILPCDYGGPNQRNPYGVAVDGTRIYWTNQGDTGSGAGGRPPFTQNASVATCELAGCCTAPLTLWTGTGNPRGIALDATAVYFVLYGSGAVWKVAKP